MGTRGRWAIVSAIIALAVSFVSPAVSHAEGTFAELCAAVSREAADAEVKMGIVVIDLATDARCEVNAEDTFRTASLYKLVVLAEAYRQAADGTFDFSAPIDLEPRHAIDDPPGFRLTETVRISQTEAASRMIRFSDNASAAALRERLGFAEVAAEPARLGMTHTELSETAFQSTPSDMARLIEGLYRGSVVDAASSRAMIDLLKQQEIADMLPAGMPSGTVIAHKTGTLDTVLHDAGVVYAPAGDYVVVAMTEHESDFDAALRAIRQLSSTVYEAYSGTTPPFAPNLAVEQRAAATRLINELPTALPQTAPALAQVPAATNVAPAEEPNFIESSGSLFGRLDAPVVPAVALATLLLMPAMVFAARIYTARRGRRPVFAEVESRLVPARRDPQMRFGNKRDQDDEQYEQYDEEQPVTRGTAVTTDPGAPAMLPSRRLQRVGELFRSHSELLDQMRTQFQDELQPLNELLARQGATMQQLLLNLEERLRPLNEYADSEESNLESLERRMRESGSDFVTRSFSEYVQQQRKRISETRQQIEQQRTPFLQYGEDQRDAVEVALARFDEDVEGLELNLSEQRKVMMRMLDSMRSESFAAVKEYLQNREEVMSELATSGMTDPGEIGRSVQALRQSIEAMANESAHIQSVLQTTDEADRRLSRIAPTGGAGTGPRPLPAQTRQTAAVGAAAEDEEEASA